MEDFKCRHTSPERVPQAAPRGLSVADLTEGRSPSCNGAARLFSPTSPMSPRGRFAAKKPVGAILRCATAAHGAGRSCPRSFDRHRGCGGRGLETAKEI